MTNDDAHIMMKLTFTRPTCRPIK